MPVRVEKVPRSLRAPFSRADTTVYFALANTSVGLDRGSQSSRRAGAAGDLVWAQVFFTRRNSSSVIASAISYSNIP
jgi:hypothetical protein